MVMKKYYVYAWYREDGTPYYIGKGEGKRAYRIHDAVERPTDKSRIKILHENLTSEEAMAKEIELIAHFGVKVKGGLLENTITKENKAFTGRRHSEETKRKMSAWQKGKPKSEAHKQALRKPRPSIAGDNNPMRRPEMKEQLEKRRGEDGKFKST
jgi:hypothetical protein